VYTPNTFMYNMCLLHVSVIDRVMCIPIYDYIYNRMYITSISTTLLIPKRGVVDELYEYFNRDV